MSFEINFDVLYALEMKFCIRDWIKMFKVVQSHSWSGTASLICT